MDSRRPPTPAEALEKINEMLEEACAAAPVREARDNFRALMSGWLADMNFATRDELERQNRLLERIDARLTEIEARLKTSSAKPATSSPAKKPRRRRPSGGLTD